MSAHLAVIDGRSHARRAFLRPAINSPAEITSATTPSPASHHKLCVSPCSAVRRSAPALTAACWAGAWATSSGAGVAVGVDALAVGLSGGVADGTLSVAPTACSSAGSGVGVLACVAVRGCAGCNVTWFSLLDPSRNAPPAGVTACGAAVAQVSPSVPADGKGAAGGTEPASAAPSAAGALAGGRVGASIAGD
jgi:hypothetical protein